MPIARLLEQGLATLDSETLLELILIEDQARRRNIWLGHLDSAVEHQRERDSLIEEWNKL